MNLKKQGNDLESKGPSVFLNSVQKLVERFNIDRQKLSNWLVMGVAVVIAYFLGRFIAFETFSPRFPVALAIGFLFLLSVWKWGLVVLLAPAVFIVWRQTQLFNFFFLEPVLFFAPFAEIAVYMALFIFLLKKGRQSISIIQKIPYMNFLYVFLLSAFMLYVFGIAPDHRMSWLAIRWCILAPMIGYLIAAAGLELQKDVERLLISFLIGSVVLSAISILAYTDHMEMVPWQGAPLKGDTAGRLYAPYQVPVIGHMILGGNVTVFFSSYAVVFCMSILMSETCRSWVKILGFLVLSMNLAALVISGSRSPMFGTFVASVMIIMLSKRSKRKAINVSVVLAAFVITILILAQTDLISEKISERFISMLTNLFTPLEYFRESGGNRALIWAQIIPAMLRYPFGTGFMESFAPAGGANVGPHSQYLFLLLGTGIIGTGSFLVFLFLCLRKCVKGQAIGDKTSRWIVVGTAGAIVTYFFNAFMIHTLVVPGADIMLLIICGAGMAVMNNSKSAAAYDRNYPGKNLRRELL
jgi:O-antigen ligase